MSSDRPIEVQHFIPQLGNVLGLLHDESARAFDEVQRNGELDRLKRIEQLGAVPRANSWASHTRWDYICLCLHITRLLSETQARGMNARVRITNKREISSRHELIQLWAILLNVGHLKWTFSTEKLLMQQLNRDDRNGGIKRDELLDGLPESVRDWASETIASEAQYRFHQVLALYRIGRWPISASTKSLFIDAVENYCISGTGSEGLVRSKELFRKVRRLAFLFLDSEFTPSTLSLRLPQLLTNPLELSRLVAPGSISGDELSGLEDHLTKSVYLSREALEHTAQTYWPMREQIRNQFEVDPIQAVIEQLAAPENEVGKNHLWNLRATGRVVAPLPSFPLVDRIRDPTDARLNIQAAAEYAKRTRSKNFYVSYEVDARKSVLVVQTHALKDDPAGGVASIAYFLEHLEATTGLLDIEGSLASFINLFEVGPQADAIMTQAVSLMFPGSTLWEWGSPVDRVRTLTGSPEVAESLMKALPSFAVLEKPRRHEIECCQDSTRGLSPNFAIWSAAPLIGYSEDGKSLVEFDGLALFVDKARNDLVLTISEAKRINRRAESSAKSSLAAKFRKIRRASDARPMSTRVRRLGKGAYASRNLRWQLDIRNPNQP